jgi:carbon storage regulator
MLVLSRKVGERIYVGRDVIITLVSIDKGRARIGITAPRDTEILREELLSERIKDATNKDK